jgi:hypothetical protein
MRILMIGILLLLAACTNGNPHPDRKAYWNQVVSKEIPPGTDKETIESWANKNSKKLLYDQKTNHFTGNLEYVVLNNWVCKGYAVWIDISLDANNKATRVELKSMGICL